jgi:hypothetical protein
MLIHLMLEYQKRNQGEKGQDHKHRRIIRRLDSLFPLYLIEYFSVLVVDKESPNPAGQDLQKNIHPRIHIHTPGVGLQLHADFVLRDQTIDATRGERQDDQHPDVLCLTDRTILECGGDELSRDGSNKITLAIAASFLEFANLLRAKGTLLNDRGVTVLTDF